MGELRQRKRLDDGIYRDQWGIAATVKVRELQREKRFPPDTGQDDQGWQDETRVALRKIAPSGARHVREGCRGYLRAVASMPTFKEREKHIALWSAEFGARARHSITTADVDAVLSRWLQCEAVAVDGAEPSHGAAARLEPLDGPEAHEPGEAGPQARLPDPEARALSYVQIDGILAAMPDVGQGLAGKARDDASKTKARLAVIAYTGLPHSLIKRLTPDCGRLAARAGRSRAGTRAKA